MDLIQGYESSDGESDGDTLVAVGGNALEIFFHTHNLLSDISLHRDRRSFNQMYGLFVVDDDEKEDFVFKTVRGNAEINNRRNRFSDVLQLSPEGRKFLQFGLQKELKTSRGIVWRDTMCQLSINREKHEAVKRGIDADVQLAKWILYCPGQGNCERACGGIGKCVDECDKQIGRHDKHQCSVKVIARIMSSNPTNWSVTIEGRHVPTGVQWQPPIKEHKISESVKDNAMKSRKYGLRQFEVFRRHLLDVPESDMRQAFEDTREHPVPDRLRDFIKNTEKRHSYKSGQWSAVDACIPKLKDQGKLLFYQEENTNAEAREMDKFYVLCLSNQTALQSAQTNQHVLGIDGKHGLQDDGACLMTTSTQHRDGFGCPAAFSVVNREVTESIYLTIRSIIENVPCPSPTCNHEYQYYRLPGNKGFRRYTPCSTVSPYRPYIMIDKHEPSANACQNLGLCFILCWFHIVKALMEKMKTKNVSLVNSYIILLGFKTVARSIDEGMAQQRWALFIEMLQQLEMSTNTKDALIKYFNDEWWCAKWKAAWLDVTRLPLVSDGHRTMTTNNHDENLNLQVADCIGSRRKKVSTLVYELTGVQAAKENSGMATVRQDKASLLDTHAAKTIAHDLNKKNSTPKDIKLRRNQARLLFLTKEIIPVNPDENPNLFFVNDDNSQVKRFRDHKGNWVTVTQDASTSMQGLLKSLHPEHVVPSQNNVMVNTVDLTCTCTDYLWRSSLRDPCLHIKAAKMHQKGLFGDMRVVQLEEQQNLAQGIRQQQLAKPRVGRNECLYSRDDEVIVGELERLHSEHGYKMWELLSTTKRTQTVDKHRPNDLPRVRALQGKPKHRAAKARPANPFRRQRVLNNVGIVTIQKPNSSMHPKFSVKKVRNVARRAANRIVVKARQQLIQKQGSPLKSTKTPKNPVAGCSNSTDSMEMSMSGCCTPVRNVQSNSVYKRLMKKKLDTELQHKQSTPYQMKMLRLKSPGLSRGQILVKLSKLKHCK